MPRGPLCVLVWTLVWTLVWVLAVAGCNTMRQLFAPQASPAEYPRTEAEEAARAAAAEEAEAEAEAATAVADRALLGEIEAAREELAEAGPSSARARGFAGLAVAAADRGAIARGVVDGDALRHEALTHLGRAREAEPEAWVDLTVAAAAVHRSCGESTRAAELLGEGLAIEVHLPLFDALVDLPRGPEVDAAVVAACSRIRPVIDEAARLAFVELCLERAGGDRAALRWDGVRGDLQAYDAERRRREERARIAAAEAKAREAAEAEEAEATRVAAAAQREVHQIAAVFAAGRCEFGDCVHRGWRAQTGQGEVRVACSFGECLTRGWDATLPDGRRATTSCSFGECMTRGWETRFPDGSRATTSCSFGECATRGWETRLPDGSTSRTTCHFSECFTRGWDTTLPGGGRITCRCSFGECLTRGADCS